MKTLRINKEFAKNFKFVKPLYRNFRTKSRMVNKHIRRNKAIVVDFTAKPGDGFQHNDFEIDNYESKLPGACENKNVNKSMPIVNDVTSETRIKTRIFFENERRRKKMEYNAMESINYDKRNGFYKLQDSGTIYSNEKAINTWLRVYPAPKLPDETISSTIFRSFLCQLGLCTFLIIWTLIWMAIINQFEGPNEREVTRDFISKENQLFIDLATELRQISPLSLKWQKTIEKRLEEERRLTVLAAGRGVRFHSIGRFWNLSGTFLILLHIMSLLGFGVPFPQTLAGRSSAFVFAVSSVPIHFYLILNASTCIVTHADGIQRRLSIKSSKKPFLDGKYERKHVQQVKELDILTRKPKSIEIKLFQRCLCILWTGRGLPLAIISYYISGAIAFGVLREKTAYEILTFPMEFTTNGGLEYITGYVRVFYALYLEGAITLIACTVASIRRCRRGAFEDIFSKYRLFYTYT